jgi:hypothetical protein
MTVRVASIAGYLIYEKDVAPRAPKSIKNVDKKYKIGILDIFIWNLNSIMTKAKKIMKSMALIFLKLSFYGKTRIAL